MKKSYLYPIFRLLVELVSMAQHSQTVSIFPIKAQNRTIRVTASPGETESQVLRRAFNKPQDQEILTRAFSIELLSSEMPTEESELDFHNCMEDLLNLATALSR